MGTNVSTNFITCPAERKKQLGIKLPFLVMIIKNLKKYFTFEVQVLDDKNVRRRFRASNYQSTTRVKPFICTMPMRLDDGWNQIQFNLSDSPNLLFRSAVLGRRVASRVQIVPAHPEQRRFIVTRVAEQAVGYIFLGLGSVLRK